MTLKRNLLPMEKKVVPKNNPFILCDEESPKKTKAIK
jgi:hypothetical protein